MAPFSATLEGLTKLVSLKEQNEPSKGKLRDIKQYLLSDKVESSVFCTDIAHFRTLMPAAIHTSDEHAKM